MLVGHADAAVHLDAFPDRELGDVRGLGLGDRDVAARPRSSPASSSRAALSAAARAISISRIKVRGAVLKRLELADQLAELLALLEVIEGHRRRARGDADQLGRRAGASRAERPLQRLPAAIDLADHRVGVELDIVEGQPRRLRAVDQRDILDLEAGRVAAARRTA